MILFKFSVETERDLEYGRIGPEDVEWNVSLHYDIRRELGLARSDMCTPYGRVFCIALHHERR